MRERERERGFLLVSERLIHLQSRPAPVVTTGSLLLHLRRATKISGSQEQTTRIGTENVVVHRGYERQTKRERERERRK